jgi:hypothetical protein
MAKPAITTRAAKGAALTYTELDTNFSNIKDATISITGGATAVTADLNGNISLVAGSNVTITGNNSAKTITIASSGGTSTWVGTATSDLNMNGFTIKSGGGGNILVDDDITFPSGTGPVVFSGGELLCRGGTITLQSTNDPGINLSGVTTGTPSNTSTPTGYIKLTINSVTRYIPYYT